MKIARKSDCHPTTTEESFQELKRWGRYLNARLYIRTQPGSILAKVMLYGVNVPSGYYSPIKLEDPFIQHTQRVWAFMPEPSRQVVFLYFAMFGNRSFKARRLNMTLNEFNQSLNRGIDFYERYRGTDFSGFDVPYGTTTRSGRGKIFIGETAI